MSARQARAYLKQGAKNFVVAQHIVDNLKSFIDKSDWIYESDGFGWMNSDYTLLDVAIRLNPIYSHKIVPYLLELGLNSNISSNKYDCTPLMSASLFRDIFIMKTFIEHHAEIDHKDEEGNTALSYACHRVYEHDHINVVKFLLAKRANPCLEDKNGLTARKLVMSREYCNKKVTEDLLCLLKRAEDAWRSGEEAKQKFMDDLKVEMAAEKLAEMNIEEPQTTTTATTTTTTQPQ